MTLDYLALALLVVIIVLAVYGVIAVYGIPYQIAKRRSHPHQDAIGAATWVSLLTLGVLWPFLWIWAMAYRPDRGWGVSANARNLPDANAIIVQFEKRLTALERGQPTRWT
jgi:hypothetical protein